MLTARTGADVRAAVRDRGRVALVPTMGALHEGHLALLRAARADGDVVVMSLFVNPTQFSPGEDLASYPRDEERDARLAAAEGVDVLFAPSEAEMYPDGSVTTVDPGPLADRLCGRLRPGHFRGVATIVTKLFGTVRPDVAFFGEKDWQQLVVIRHVVRDLALGVEVRGVPTVRAGTGLALSSRNGYLTAADRTRAESLSAALFEARRLYDGGEREGSALLAAALAQLVVDPEYLELAERDELGPYDPNRPAVLAVAARVGSARLIDNVTLEGRAA